jgi:hypothetical protein
MTAGSMFTRMAKSGSSFKTTLKVPPGSILDYEFLAPTELPYLTQGETEQAAVVVDYRGGRTYVSLEVKKAELEQH